VLFRNATVLEAAAKVDTVVFDKTGTLTEGRPSVTDVIPAAGVEETELLRLAAAADAQSEHPLATAVVAAAKKRALVVDPPSHFEAIPGHGVQATVGGRTVLVGNRKLLERNGVTLELEREAERLRGEAKTALYVAADGGCSVSSLSPTGFARPPKVLFRRSTTLDPRPPPHGGQPGHRRDRRSHARHR